MTYESRHGNEGPHDGELGKAFSIDWAPLHYEYSSSLAGDSLIVNSSSTVKVFQIKCVPGPEDGEGRAGGKSPASLGKDGSFHKMEDSMREEGVGR